MVRNHEEHDMSTNEFMQIEEKNYLWEHFVFNAEQRLKAFNFFVIFSVFANGGVFAAAEKKSHGLMFVLIGGFVMALSIIFWIIDARSKTLIRLAEPGLLLYEKQFRQDSQLFSNDKQKKCFFISYTIAFRTLFILQILFGIGVAIYGFYNWICVQ